MEYSDAGAVSAGGNDYTFARLPADIYSYRHLTLVCLTYTDRHTHHTADLHTSTINPAVPYSYANFNPRRLSWI